MKKFNYNKPVSEQEFSFFVIQISKLEEIEFLGLAKMLCVQVYSDEGEPRSFEEILSDVLDKYLTLSGKLRKDFINLLQRLEKEKKKEAKNAT